MLIQRLLLTLLMVSVVLLPTSAAAPWTSVSHAEHQPVVEATASKADCHDTSQDTQHATQHTTPKAHHDMSDVELAAVDGKGDTCCDHQGSANCCESNGCPAGCSHCHSHNHSCSATLAHNLLTDTTTGFDAVAFVVARYQHFNLQPTPPPNIA